jgi:hypothetical protein
MLQDVFIRHETFLCYGAGNRTPGAEARGTLAGCSGYRGKIVDDRRVIGRNGILSRLCFAPHETKPELRHFCTGSFAQAAS